MEEKYASEFDTNEKGERYKHCAQCFRNNQALRQVPLQVDFHEFFAYPETIDVRVRNAIHQAYIEKRPAIKFITGRGNNNTNGRFYTLQSSLLHIIINGFPHLIPKMTSGDGFVLFDL